MGESLRGEDGNREDVERGGALTMSQSKDEHSLVFKDSVLVFCMRHCISERFDLFTI